MLRAAHHLRHCDEGEVVDTYQEVLREAEHLFWLEQILMEDYLFPARQTHLEQHARVLRGLHVVHCAVLSGEASAGRRAGAELLTHWLRLHNDTLDAAFHLWMDCCDCGLIDPRSPQQATSLMAH